MKYIRKNLPPQSLIDYRKDSEATYNNLKKNQAIYLETKISLCKEQGYICCYCGRRINGDRRTQIEHLYPKGYAQYKDMQLDYENNLLACCDGGKSELADNAGDKNYLYCDAAKGEQIIPISPLTVECENKFIFDENGDVFGTGKDAEATIKILNLNSPIIKNMRKYAIDYYEEYCNSFTADDWRHEVDELNNMIDGKFVEFCFVLQSYIKLKYLGD